VSSGDTEVVVNDGRSAEGWRILLRRHPWVVWLSVVFVVPYVVGVLVHLRQGLAQIRGLETRLAKQENPYVGAVYVADGVWTMLKGLVWPWVSFKHLTAQKATTCA
jgi:hypothetical protein